MPQALLDVQHLITALDFSIFLCYTLITVEERLPKRKEIKTMYTRYFFVTCHRGHCGIGHSTEIKFAIAAANLLEAMDKARRMPSVKHTRMIISGAEITQAEYDEYRKHSAYERYNQNYGRR